LCVSSSVRAGAFSAGAPAPRADLAYYGTASVTAPFRLREGPKHPASCWATAQNSLPRENWPKTTASR